MNNNNSVKPITPYASMPTANYAPSPSSRRGNLTASTQTHTSIGRQLVAHAMQNTTDSDWEDDYDSIFGGTCLRESSAESES